jgi:betaine-aldehyde dehydrogenase
MMDKLPFDVKFLIEGKQVAAKSGKTRQILNPASGQPLAIIADAAEIDINLAVESAQRAFTTGPWAKMNSAERTSILLKIAGLIRENAAELAELESMNVGKPLRESLDEASMAASIFEYYAGAINKTGGQTIPVAASGVSMTFREPIGVCAQIVPWNFPMIISAWKMAPALAMGNTIIVKPASQTPLTALRLAAIALEAGLPPGVLNVVTGPGSQVGEALVKHPAVRKISFTGSTEIGTHVMKMAADDIKRVTLELGGKSANIVFADAEWDAALTGSTWSVLGNAGQDCCARSRLLVEKSIYDKFLSELSDRFAAIRLGDPLDIKTEMGPLISTNHRNNVSKYIEIGVNEGANLVTGGQIPEDEPFNQGAYLLPTLFSQVSNSMQIAREEIFGPVLCAIPFKDEEEAISIANSSDYGLSGSIWTRDLQRALSVARAVETGVLSVNTAHSVHIEAPFGGVKKSGVGRELGMAVLDHYSELKSIFIHLDK